MTNRQRVIDAVNFKKTDYVPYSVGFTGQAWDKTVALMGEDYLKSVNDHISSVDLGKPQVETEPGHFKDEFGVVWNKTGADKDIGYPDFWLIPDRESFERNVFPDVDEQYVRDCMEALGKMPDTQFRGASIGFSLFERLWTMMGMENALSNMLLDPELVHDALNAICERNLKVIGIALEYDFDYFYFGDDWGQQNGLIMGITHWREFIRPYLKKMYSAVRESGRYIGQHSCGDIRLLLDDLHELGLNIYQTFQPEIYGLDYAEKLRGKIAVWGAISTQRDLPDKTPGEIREITKKTLAAFREHGGLIAAPTHAIPGDVPVENIVAMLDAAYENSFY